MNTVAKIDASVWSWWVDHRVESLTSGIVALTSVTGPTMVAVYSMIIAAIVAVKTRRVWSAAILPAAVLTANLASHVLKATIGRERPPEVLRLVEETNYAMPSGHATGLAASAMILTLWLGRGGGAPVPARWVVPGVWVLTAVVSGTRLYLGVHWLTDIIAGLLLGAVVAVVSWALLARVR